MSSRLTLSNTSFTSTSKDFQEIYEEILNTAKELSYKWDPTVSNESDPGVTLLKELALVLDKINYSADKNALETMPLSVTLQRTAHQLFNILGYYPKWFISAEMDVSVAWKIDESVLYYNTGGSITLPAFTLIRDSESNFVYTIPQQCILKDNATITTTKAVQGIVKDLSVNNQTLITLDALDDDLRVYFPDYNVAQNGVFIYFADGADNLTNRSFWEQKDNLLVEESGNNYYGFNVDISSGRCYVQFPKDIADLIGTGLYIKYLISSGIDGNAAINSLTEFYQSGDVVEYSGDESIKINVDSENIFVQNTNLVLSGKNQETIEDSYENLKRVQGTFDTLVTLRDYNNALYNTKLASNGFVCDRTNDILTAYTIVESDISDNTNILYEQDSINDVDEVSPFDLKIYALLYNDAFVEGTSNTGLLTNINNYYQTFLIFEDRKVEDRSINSGLYRLTQLLNDEKCISHKFRDILANKMCLLKNIAEISVRVTPTISLTKNQKDALLIQIYNMLFSKYNSREVEFGLEIDYDELHKNILTCSDYIKSVYVNAIDYYTHAVYFDDGSSNEQIGGAEDLRPGWKEICISDENDFVIVNRTGTGPYVWRDSASNNILDPGSGYINTGCHFLYLGENNNYILTIEDGKVVLYSAKRDEFRKEILVKNILAGITPYIVLDDSKFKYQIDQTAETITPVEIQPITTLEFDLTNGSDTKTLRENEVIQLVKPLLITEVTYGAYVRYEYMGSSVTANTDHKLIDNEKLRFYYKTNDNDAEPYVVMDYDSTSKNSIICPSFDLTQTSVIGSLSANVYLTPEIAESLSASSTIAIKSINDVTLSDPASIYVVGNGDENSTYKLFFTNIGTEEAPLYEVTLNQDEFFLYTNLAKTVLLIAGSGTKITISDLIPGIMKQSDDGRYYLENKAVSMRNINMLGVSALLDMWITISGANIRVLAQEFINISGEGATFTLGTVGGLISDTTVKLDNEGLHIDDDIEEAACNVILSDTEEFDYATGKSSATNIVNDESVLIDWLQEDVSDGGYGLLPNKSASGTILFTSLDFPTATKSQVYINNEPQTISGYVTNNGTIYNTSKKVEFIINGSSLYLCLTDGTATTITQILTYAHDSVAADLGYSYSLEDIYFNYDSNAAGTTFEDLAFTQVTIEGNSVYVPTPATWSSGDTTANNVVLKWSYNSWNTGNNQPISGVIYLKLVYTDYTVVDTTESVINHTATQSSANIVTINRLWLYTNAYNEVATISDYVLRNSIGLTDYSDMFNSSFSEFIWPLTLVRLRISYDIISSTDASSTLYGFSVAYQNPNEDPVSIVESDTPELRYSIAAYMQMTLNNLTISRLYDGQKLNYKLSGDVSYQTYSGSDTDVIGVYSNKEFYVDGSKPISTYLYDAEKLDYYNPILLLSNLSNYLSGNTSRNNISLVMVLEIPAGSVGVAYEFACDLLSSNDYLLEIDNAANLNSLSVAVNGDPIDSLSGNFTGVGKYFYIINSGTIDIDVTCDSASNSQYIYIKPLKQISNYNGCYNGYGIEENNISNDSIESLINQLDTEKRFNYGIEIDSAVLIDKPLSSSLFNNSNHMYNKYTICQVRPYDYLQHSTINLLG